MADFWADADLDVTIRDFEFTRRAMRNIRYTDLLSETADSGDFEDMTAQAIFTCLLERMEIVSFGEYLRRYLYLNAQIAEPFQEVPEETYVDLIKGSFEDTFTPHSFEPTTKRWSAIVRDWLRVQSVRRQTVFLLGFGLRMEQSEVSDFLTKVIKEEDFDPLNAEEVIFRYCFAQGLPYAEAERQKRWYQELPCAEIAEDPAQSEPSIAAWVDRMQEIRTEQDLRLYLTDLKASRAQERTGAYVQRRFLDLLEQAKATAAELYAPYEVSDSGKVWSVETVSMADLERILCSGIPSGKGGNLKKMSASLLSRCFLQKRMSRQRLEKLVNRKASVDRFDLITLQFFISSQALAEEAPQERCRHAMDAINALLVHCHMHGLYPVNPYEAFILMCLLSEDPLSTYTEVWEMSFEEEAV